MNHQTEFPVLAPDPLAGVPLPFMQGGMCRAPLAPVIEGGDPRHMRCCGEPVISKGARFCAAHGRRAGVPASASSIEKASAEF